MRRTHIVALAAAAALGLAGCGGPTETSGLNLPEYTGATPGATATSNQQRTPDELLAGARAAIAEEAMITVFGDTRSEGAGDLGGSMSFNGDAGTGVFSFGGGMLTLLYADGKAWYKGDSQVYRSFGVPAEAITKRIGDKWIIAGSSNPKLTRIDVPASRAEFLNAVIDPAGAVTATDETEIDGVAAIGLVSDRGTLSIAADTLLPLRLVLTGDAGEGIDFTYDDEVAAPAALTADQIVDLADLK